MAPQSQTTAAGYAKAMLAAAADLGFAPAGEATPAALTLTARLMDCKVADAAAAAAVAALQPAAALVLTELGRPVGVVATLLMRADQTDGLFDGGFDGLRPRADQICAPGQAPAAYYIWGVAGETRTAKWASMELCRRFRFGVLAPLVGYTRVATPDGRRAAQTRLGFGPALGPEDNLLVSPPILERRAA
jgi:hypothetical protein